MGLWSARRPPELLHRWMTLMCDARKLIQAHLCCGYCKMKNENGTSVKLSIKTILPLGLFAKLPFINVESINVFCASPPLHHKFGLIPLRIFKKLAVFIYSLQKSNKQHWNVSHFVLVTDFHQHFIQTGFNTLLRCYSWILSSLKLRIFRLNPD